MPSRTKLAAIPAKPLRREFVDVLAARIQEPKPLIQVALGPRQVGKTTGVLMLEPEAPDAFCYASADDRLGSDARWLEAQWQEAKRRSADPLLVIDEIQKIENWSGKIKSLWDAERRRGSRFRLVLLGSSSLDIQRGLDESLAGRFELVSVPHWSFAESHRHFGFDLDEYLAFGGYPEAARFRADPRRWRDYLLNSIIDSVVGKDILRNHTVRKPALFRQCFELLCALPAQEISYNKLLGQLQEGGNVELVKYYIELFEGAFLFRSLPKFTGSIVRQKASSPKILPLCPALSAAVLGNAIDDGGATRGRLFESAVGAMLLQLPGTLSYWREKNGLEVDFVCQLGKDLIACEVKSGRQKSTRGLDAFLQAYPKARTLFITPENFAAFSKSPEAFIRRVL